MSEQYGEKYEKEAEKAEKEHEKQEKTWEEKWRHDPVGAVIWATTLIWAGLVLLVDNLQILAGYGWFDAWGAIFAGAGILVWLGAAFRLIVPAYRRPIGGTLIWGAILLGIGLGNIIGASIAWPLVLIAIGIGLLIQSLLR